MGTRLTRTGRTGGGCRSPSQSCRRYSASARVVEPVHRTPRPFHRLHDVGTRLPTQPDEVLVAVVTAAPAVRQRAHRSSRAARTVRRRPAAGAGRGRGRRRRRGGSPGRSCIASAAFPGRLSRQAGSAGSGGSAALSKVRDTMSATRKECRRPPRQPGLPRRSGPGNGMVRRPPGHRSPAPARTYSYRESGSA